MKKGQVQYIQVPHYDELSVLNIRPEFKKDMTFASFFPSKWAKDKGPPRQYFFNILNTLYPEYLQEVMAHANSQRMTGSGDAMKKQSIEISKFWEEELKSMPYLTCK